MRNGVPSMLFDLAACAPRKRETLFRTLTKTRHMAGKLNRIGWILCNDSTKSVGNPFCRARFTCSNYRESASHGFGNDHSECVVRSWENKCVARCIHALNGSKGRTKKDSVTHSGLRRDLQIQCGRRVRNEQQLGMRYVRQSFDRG